MHVWFHINTKLGFLLPWAKLNRFSPRGWLCRGEKGARIWISLWSSFCFHSLNNNTSDFLCLQAGATLWARSRRDECITSQPAFKCSLSEQLQDKHFYPTPHTNLLFSSMTWAQVILRMGNIFLSHLFMNSNIKEFVFSVKKICWHQ